MCIMQLHQRQSYMKCQFEVSWIATVLMHTHFTHFEQALERSSMVDNNL